jgi:F1F0 ATPase subunit 2
MNNITLSTLIVLMMAFAVGSALGAFYFIALWRTVLRLPSTTSPVRLMLGSIILRMAVVMAGFYFVMGGHWERLAAAMLGFIVMRKIITHYFGPQKAVEEAN